MKAYVRSVWILLAILVLSGLATVNSGSNRMVRINLGLAFRMLDCAVNCVSHAGQQSWLTIILAAGAGKSAAATIHEDLCV